MLSRLLHSLERITVACWLAFLVACGGGTASPPPPPPPPPTLSIAATLLPAAEEGQPYSFTFHATGGTGALTWTGSSLPGGMSFAADGTLSGTPATFGAFTFQVQVQDSGNPRQTATTFPTLGVARRLTLDTVSSFPHPNRGVPYDVTFFPAGGKTPYSLAISAGNLPAGLTLQSPGNFGEINGTATQAGNFPFTLVVTDSSQPPE